MQPQQQATRVCVAAAGVLPRVVTMPAESIVDTADVAAKLAAMLLVPRVVAATAAGGSMSSSTPRSASRMGLRTLMAAAAAGADASASTGAALSSARRIASTPGVDVDVDDVVERGARTAAAAAERLRAPKSRARIARAAAAASSSSSAAAAAAGVAASADTGAAAAASSSRADDSDEVDVPATPGKTRPSRRRAAKETVARPGDEYFLQSSRRRRVSSRTLAKSGIATGQVIEELIDSVPDPLLAAKQRLVDSYSNLFARWLYYVDRGHNLLLYGFGSKQPVVDMLAQTTLDRHVVTVRHAVDPLLEAQQRILLVVHNIDGRALRHPAFQSYLSELAQRPRVSIVASIDHINATLMWDGLMLAHFRWLYIDATTFLPYLDEMRGRSLASSAAGDTSADRAAPQVLRSLTENSRNVFFVLASARAAGLSFAEWFERCFECFFITSEAALRQIQQELASHRMIVRMPNRKLRVNYSDVAIDKLAEVFGVQLSQFRAVGEDA